MNEQTLASLKAWFNGYVPAFRSHHAEDQKNIDIKIEHSHRVCEAVLEIGRSTGLNGAELNLAEAAALFHDIGRFEQYRRYKTFSDHRSVNHAELGVRILEENHVLQEVPEPAREILLRAISNHNRLAIPEGESETIRFFSRLVRDADKLDIWRVVTEHYSSENGNGNGVTFGLSDTPGVSASVYRDLMEHKMVLMSHLKNVNDFKLLQIGWVYDVTFPKTLELLDRRGYLQILREMLPPSQEVDRVYSEVISTMHQRMKRTEKGPMRIRMDSHTFEGGAS